VVKAKGLRRIWLVATEHKVWSGVVIGLLVTVLGAAVLAVPQLISSAIASRNPDWSCTDHGDLTLLAAGEVRAQSSSSRENEGSLSYVPEMAVDGRDDTAWVEGADGLGDGETLTLTFEAVRVELVCVVNGYSSDQDYYARNARVRDYVALTDSGERGGVLLSGDDQFKAYQEIEIAAGPTSRLQLEIVSAQAGVNTDKGRSFDDTAISEVQVYVSR
jgi:hypothetical protein